MNELLAKIKEDAALAAKFADCKSADDVVAIAKEAGFEITAEEVEKLTDVSAEDLAGAAGGKPTLIKKYLIIK